jgi:hypothetical protein
VMSYDVMRCSVVWCDLTCSSPEDQAVAGYTLKAISMAQYTRIFPTKGIASACHSKYGIV